MTDLPSLTPRKVIKVLERAGFLFVRQKGSHRIYQRGRKVVVVPYHSRDLKKPTLRNIVHQAGFTTEEFVKLL